MKNLFYPLLVIALISTATWGQSCDSASIIVTPVRASDTDANIPWEAFRHHTFYNPDCSPKNVLLVHLVGTFGNPVNTLNFTSLAANNGFHVVSLKYENDLSAQTACSSSTDPDCHYKFRREIIEGQDLSPEVAVDSVSSIYNRLLRLLQYMDANYPAQNWGQYFAGNNINWNATMVSGHSQGGGHAAVIAINKPLARVLMFASPNDYSTYFGQTAPWTNLPHLTEDSVYYSFNNIHDQVAQYNWQYTAALNLGVGNYGDTVNVDNSACPYNWTHNLYTSIDSSGFNSNHGMVVNDAELALDSSGKPIFEPVWRYMLGLGCTTTSVSEESTSTNFTIYPNPAEEYINVLLKPEQLGQVIEVCDARMRVLLRRVSTDLSTEIQLPSLPAGIYFVGVDGHFRKLMLE